MNNTIIKIVSIVFAVGAMTLGYQNCSKSGFASTETASSSRFGGDGYLTGMDENGNLFGVITLNKCPDSGCPESLEVTIDSENDQLVGNTQAQVSTEGFDASDLPLTYEFTFQVPQDQKCKALSVYFTNPNTNLKSILSEGRAFVVWGGECGGGVPIAEIINITQDGPYITIHGQCTSGKDVAIANGPIGFDGSIRCINGEFKYCARLDEVGSISLLLQQILGGQTAEVTQNFTIHTPGMLIFEIQSVVVIGTIARTTVKCTIGGKVTFNIYNSDKAKLDCTTGTIVYDVPLVAGLSNRVLYVTQTTPFAVSTTLQIDVDANNFVPECAINNIENDNFCDDKSVKLTGSCQAGWPVFVKVDGKLQDLILCSGQGQFEADRVILDDKLGGSSVSIEQINPVNTAKKCSDSKSL